ncbi:uncharacterized protein LOC108904037 [Anoplophora glabripennis]|uniref:uncharacterized protein LOC108904037 n=1 Tax=Anoplophora glabripennis TaxID=217634 RepID=UPI0008736A23|nr:uncharacterized protein LOC108904037 [Anoplophora glabripennis]XP_018561925.1 uncharacterized protein LOC108904037 [Anoplophora glabripennis]XP_018561926.1 uncharacterized protein LOC108904037 [Anoplophora glabripennis]XP_018561927.1 uncharacterized protein LOC108904037 [Anoplophora glabripennis]
MQEYLSLTNRKLCFVGFVTSCLVLIILYYDNCKLNFELVFPTEQIEYEADSNFLVSNSKCKMMDLDPFNKDAKKFFRPEKYKPCRTLELLSYLTKNDNTATLHIDKEIVPSYSSDGVSCCYANVTRKISASNPDGHISISKCQHFEDNVTLHHEFVSVKCTDTSSKKHKVYENAYASITVKEDVQKKLDNFDNTTKQLSVLIVGIDSISRLNFIRTLPNTYKYVEDNGWQPLKGYNKMGDNTFPNVMAVLTGFDESHAFKVCNPREVGQLDACPMLWYDYKKLGYVTGYAEDEGSINTFNFRKKGFKDPPVDYYFRPYILATETLAKVRKDEMTYCTGPETAGERILDVAKEFAITFKDYPSFGLFWMNSFSHNKLNSPTGMDNKIRSFLNDLDNSGVTENSIVIFLSDHGIRFGDIRLTETGWLEERLPFIYVSFPKWFKEKFPIEYRNFQKNFNRLTSPYDLHMTLKHILVLSGHNFTMTPSQGCPKCRTLFEEADQERSCEDAGIEQHWCTCAGYTGTNLDKEVENKVKNYVLDQIHDIIRSRNSEHLCAKYSVEKIISSSLSHQFFYKNDTYLLVKFQTKPKAVYETTIGFKGNISSNKYSLSGDISRLDSYSERSKCVGDAYLKKYCYCRSNGSRV